MPIPSEREAIALVVSHLSDLMGRRPRRVVTEVDGADVRIAFTGHTFVAEWRASSTVAAVTSGLRALESGAGRAIPILAVPHMGEAGRALCEGAGVSWLDLSGNAHVEAPGLRVVIEGKPNLFKRVGRPNTAFAPKSARIARWLLMHPEPTTQRDLAAATGMDAGFTSRIVHRLIDDRLVERASDGRVVAPRPALLLDAWAEQYRFDRHRIRKGVVAARSGTELAERLGERLARSRAEHSFTGLVAAWQYTRFAAFRIATVFLPAGAPDALINDLGLREGDQGANTWLVVPDDLGVLHGSTDIDGLSCVHPVQAWLDLGAHPERAKDAADRLRSQVIDA